MSRKSRPNGVSASIAKKRATPLNIAFYRKRAGLSQGELADKLRIRRETLCRIERGRQYLTEGMEQRIAVLLALSDDERNHMLGLPLGAGTGAARRAPRPGSDSTIRLVAGRRGSAGPTASHGIAPHTPRAPSRAGTRSPERLALVGRDLS